MKKQLLSFVALICAVSAWGQAEEALYLDDVTSSYLSNADLMALNGWKFTSNRVNNKKSDYENHVTTNAVPVIEFYHTWSSNAGAATSAAYNFEMAQTVTLPAGKYRLATHAFYREGNGNGTNTKAYLLAGAEKAYLPGLTADGLDKYQASDALPKAAEAFSKGDFPVALDFTVAEEGAVKLGLGGVINTYVSWCITGPFTLYRCYTLSEYRTMCKSLSDKAKAMYELKMSRKALAALETVAEIDPEELTEAEEFQMVMSMLEKSIAEAEASVAEYAGYAEELAAVKASRETLHVTDEDAAAFTAAWEDAYSDYDNGTMGDFDAVKDELGGLLVSLAKKQTTPGSDMTLAIVNPDCTAVKEGWTTVGTVGNKSDEHWSGVTDTYLEPCNWGASNWTASFTQTLTDLPAGEYRLTAAGRASSGATLKLTANDQSATYRSLGNTGGTIATDGSEWESVAAGKEAGKTFAGKTQGGLGWTYASVDVTVLNGTLIIGCTANASRSQQWASIDDFRLMFLNTATGIEEVTVADEPETVDVYTISGMPVLRGAAPSALKSLKKGIYIVNGSKVVIR